MWSAVLLLTAILAGICGWGWLQFQPASRTYRPVSVVVEPGANLTTVSAVLRRQGVIRNALALRWVARSWNGRWKVRAGLYTLSPDMSLAQIIQRLQQGPEQPPADQVRVTVPEGYTLRQIAEVLHRQGVTDREQFLACATDGAQIARLQADFPLPARTLEGYLYPDTYYFRRKTPAVQVIQTFLANFSRRFARPYQQEIRASGRTLHHLVTVASLIEREARVPQDRARIAGVLDNRLQRGMRLEVDASVLYALGTHRERVLYRDLKVDSPYNTYRHRGLPPGPIANPGLEALRAALHPEPHAYLYYVARPDGSHIFTSTYEAHQAAVRRARAERATLERRKEERPGG
ncbi:MAG: endolytic transglycosylase MltG [Chloroherpetonaceae bacterium]|nr:endolytic transglycosylase MltG [Chthonomonadaceae bacterium]MDW8207961.1 endolytic transglycosylase MltG [Chloroherpetonaceae bacterium]